MMPFAKSLLLLCLSDGIPFQVWFTKKGDPKRSEAGAKHKSSLSKCSAICHAYVTESSNERGKYLKPLISHE